MRKINNEISQSLQLSDTIFKYPVQKGIVENLFDPNIDKDFEKYMLIKNDNGEIRLSKVFMFTKENQEAILNIKSIDLLDGTWWVIP
jgi:hypothetical protein